jgi:hypothetical protein
MPSMGARIALSQPPLHGYVHPLWLAWASSTEQSARPIKNERKLGLNATEGISEPGTLPHWMGQTKPLTGIFNVYRILHRWYFPF